MVRQLYQEDINSLALEVHEWFINNPLGTTEEGFDHFWDWFSKYLDPFSEGYQNYN